MLFLLCRDLQFSVHSSVLSANATNDSPVGKGDTGVFVDCCVGGGEIEAVVNIVIVARCWLCLLLGAVKQGNCACQKTNCCGNFANFCGQECLCGGLLTKIANLTHAKRLTYLSNCHLKLFNLFECYTVLKSNKTDLFIDA